MLGANFEREIREQPDLWRAIAQSDKAETLARTIADRDVVLLGSGSSLFMAQLGALALRRHGIRAHALPATEAPLDHAAYDGCAAIACSQSGRSADLLAALDVLRPGKLIALTNTSASPLGERADVTIDVGAGPEIAIPASKSVTGMAAILLWGAGLLASDRHMRNAASLTQTADAVAEYLDGAGVRKLADASASIAKRRSVIVVGTGYGTPIASESALKLKEASYIHAEGFSAGEFRHGSAAILDASCAIIGIVDDISRETVRRPLDEARRTGSLRYVIGAPLDEIPLLGPTVGPAFNTLAWLVSAQLIALHVGRARSVDSDAPRGLSKALV